MLEKDRKVAFLNLNPPTERSIAQVLQKIAMYEGVRISEKEVQDIRDQSNKDLRNAIITL
jgi:DNA polymerase III delta prime subunit